MRIKGAEKGNMRSNSIRRLAFTRLTDPPVISYIYFLCTICHTYLQLFGIDLRTLPLPPPRRGAPCRRRSGGGWGRGIGLSRSSPVIGNQSSSIRAEALASPRWHGQRRSCGPLRSLSSRSSAPGGCKHARSLSPFFPLPSLCFTQSILLTGAGSASVGGLWFSESIRFSTLSGSEIRKSAEVQVWNSRIYGQDLKPVPNGLLDAQMVITHT
jgi:hypothetical protein